MIYNKIYMGIIISLLTEKKYNLSLSLHTYDDSVNDKLYFNDSGDTVSNLIGFLKQKNEYVQEKSVNANDPFNFIIFRNGNSYDLIDGKFTFDGTKLTMISDDQQEIIKIGENNKIKTRTTKNTYIIYVTKPNINSIKSNDYIINIQIVSKI